MRDIRKLALAAVVVVVVWYFREPIGNALWAVFTGFSEWFTSLVLAPLTD